ncbi:hypothetical protein SHI21_19360 [Bacteriovorax sp. PP10]|uniref:Lipoprotein n=1 Tax=Bacteriovorax antarcticus TaxID=3088717 RepID=A0ABU5W195_9BACT|nr:hypothetical protein [Bacteriovorax sp. PP10]MEA9358403.1 hypothetical protein [Bacteriovorax sp. PP10]
MKKLILVLSLVPTLSFASIYSCSGAGYSVELTGNPVEMKVTGNGVNAMAKDVSVSQTFNTVVAGNIISPAATVKLTIRDASFGNPGDRFNAAFQVSSAAGVKNYAGTVCIRGNE